MPVPVANEPLPPEYEQEMEKEAHRDQQLGEERTPKRRRMRFLWATDLDGAAPSTERESVPAIVIPSAAVLVTGSGVWRGC